MIKITNIEKIHKKAELIYDTIVSVAINTLTLRKNETMSYMYSRDRKIGVNIGFFDAYPQINLHDKTINILMGYAIYVMNKGTIYLNLRQFKDPNISKEEKLKVIRHELGHIREIRLYNNSSEEAAIRYE